MLEFIARNGLNWQRSDADPDETVGMVEMVAAGDVELDEVVAWIERRHCARHPHPGALMPNRLSTSTSPYLRQHADNPVEWREWGEDAFTEARDHDVPIFLSVGYSACHWCHVMAHESAG
jgi:hypothetical protein